MIIGERIYLNFLKEEKEKVHFWKVKKNKIWITLLLIIAIDVSILFLLICKIASSNYSRHINANSNYNSNNQAPPTFQEKGPHLVNLNVVFEKKKAPSNKDLPFTKYI